MQFFWILIKSILISPAVNSSFLERQKVESRENATYRRLDLYQEESFLPAPPLDHDSISKLEQDTTTAKTVLEIFYQ